MNIDMKLVQQGVQQGEKELEAIYAKMAFKDPHKAVLGCAGAAAGVVALAPRGVDAVLLQFCEILMVLSICSHYGVKLSKASVKAFLMAGFAKRCGEAIAIPVLEAANAMVVDPTILPIMYMIKLGVATTVIKNCGNLLIKSFDRTGGESSTAGVLINSMCAIGLSEELSQVSEALNILVSKSPMDDASYMQLLESKIQQATQKADYWDAAIKDYETDINSEGGYVLEAVMSDHWHKALDNLIQKKKEFESK